MAGNLNLPSVAKEYVRKLIAEAGAGMKVLILDDVTVRTPQLPWIGSLACCPTLSSSASGCRLSYTPASNWRPKF